MLPNATNTINRWFESSYNEEINGIYVNTSDRMELFANTKEINSELKKMLDQDKALECANKILDTFDKHEIGEAEILAKWIAHNTTISKKGAYKSLHSLFETIANLKNSPHILDMDADVSNVNPCLLNIGHIDAAACDYGSQIKIIYDDIATDIQNLIIKNYMENSSPKDNSDLLQTSKLMRQQIATIFKGPLTQLGITSANEALAYAKEFGNSLSYLDISNIQFSNKKFKKLIKHLHSTKNFIAQETHLNFLDLKVFANSENPKNLISLTFSKNKANSVGAMSIVNSEKLKSLTSLTFSYNNIGDGGATSLANSENLKNLTSLNLRSNEIGINGLQAIINSRYLKKLTSLDFGVNKIGSEGAVAIANSENLKNLTSLDLGANEIGIKGIEAIANSKNLQNLISLNLGGNKVGTEALEIIANSENFKNLTSLHLRCNQIGIKGREILLNSKNLKNLTSLIT